MTVKPETLTDEMVREWWESTEKHFRHQLAMWDALGEKAGPCYREPTKAETLDARQRICDTINARKGV